jgi:hypothetical protein
VGDGAAVEGAEGAGAGMDRGRRNSRSARVADAAPTTPADAVFLQNYRRLSRWRFLYSIAHAYAACKGSPAT